MRHIIRGQPTLAEQCAADAALTAHQQKYGDYARSKNCETYQVSVADRTYSIEVMNRKASYVATVMNHHRSLSKICEVPA
ncbi:DUF4060 family protein [Hafnia psychrotolerans]|uniref:DUF4060 family protein n=1 Tax=Hafnia psychrotolerans TaxID=1477018 RepID=A0ABQ1G846_9GAMM|nr:DUF4060 family protein [Hafnia psychrotolerans]GGA38572.1 hypothetical protein GCM10011328_11770 [Hafnia psychrotolerans]